jgi:hypothetical protein
VRAVVVAVCVLSLLACGSKEPSAYERANVALLATLPVYPGAAAPKTTTSGNSTAEFGARDWTLPAHTRASAVVDWYVQRLQQRGWKVTGKSFDTIRANRGNASLSVGVRGRTLELVANSRGH